MALLDRLPDLAADNQNLAKVGDAFRLVNVRLFLKFEKVQVKKRTLNKLAHGIVTFGEAPPPVPLYAGPTGRRAIAANRGRQWLSPVRKGAFPSRTSLDLVGRETR